MPAVRMTQRSKFKNKQAQRYLAYKEQIGWEAKAAGVRLSHGPFQVSAKLFIDCSKPDMDVDNLGKAIMDGMNGIAWHDDRQVIRLEVEKEYVTKASDEKAVIEIKEVSA